MTATRTTTTIARTIHTTVSTPRAMLPDGRSQSVRSRSCHLLGRSRTRPAATRYHRRGGMHSLLATACLVSTARPRRQNTSQWACIRARTARQLNELVGGCSWQRLLSAQVASGRHSGERESSTSISVFHCLSWSCPDEWLRPVLDQFEHGLAIDHLETTRFELSPARRHTDRDPWPAIATPVPYGRPR